MIDRVGASASPTLECGVGASAPATAAPSGDFATFLAAAEQHDLRFYSHALKRMEERQIALNSEDVSRLADGVEQAQSKGSRDSLLLMNNSAFVVNVPNRTVVTALDSEAMKGKTFTHIDSAILLLQGA